MTKKNLSRCVIVLFCLSLIFVMFPIYGKQAKAEEVINLVRNPQFEEPFQIPGWNIVEGDFTISADQAIEGNNSLLFAADQQKMTIESDTFQLLEGTYSFTFQIYNDHVKTGALRYGLEFYNLDGELIEKQSPTAVSTEKRKWMNVEKDIVAPPSTVTAKIYFTSDEADGFTTYIDQIEISNEQEDEIEISNSHFEKPLDIPGWTSTGNLITIMRNEGSNFLRLHDYSANNQVQVKSELIPISSNQRYKASAKMKVIEQSHSVEFALSFFNDKNERIHFKNELHKGKAGLGWIDIELEGDSPEDAVAVQITFNSGAISLTDAYFNDVVLEALSEEIDEPSDDEKEEEEDPLPSNDEISNNVVNPGFEAPLLEDGHILGWTPENQASGISLDDKISFEGNQSLHFHDTSETEGLKVLSNKIDVSPGKSYLAKVQTNVIHQTHNIVYEIHYFNEDDKEIDVKMELFGNLPKGEWSELKLLTTAPDTAAYARLAFYSGGISLTEAYFDDVRFELDTQDELVLDRVYQSPENLGEMVQVQLGQASVIQENELGENEIYYHSNGLPGTFSVLDAETGKLKFSEVIKGTEALWAMTIGADKNVYFASTGDGKLYRYLPAQKKIEELGVNPSDDWVWDLEASSDGKIYGSTYPNASVFEYDIETRKFKDFGPIDKNEDYARGIAVDENYIYVGIGATRHLYKVNRSTGEKEEIIIEGYSGEEGFFEDIFLINDKLLVSNGSINMLVVDPETNQVIHQFQYSNMVSNPSKANENIIYYKFQSQFFKYNFSTNESTLIEDIPILPDTVRVKDMEWITLKSGKKVLAIVTQYGEYMLFDPVENKMTFLELDIASQAVAIQSLETGHDGRLYMGGYQRGMSIYNPFKNEIDLNISAFAQPEGIGFLNEKVYYGTYVGAIMYGFDPRKPVDLNTNPHLEYDIGHQQDRPFAITSGNGQLFVGTVPDYGVLGGVLAIYNDKTNKWQEYRNVVKDQSIIGLAYKDGKLYGGTSVWGGLGIEPKAEAAKIFVWDVEKGKKVKEFIPQIPNIDETPRMIGELSFGPDGNLWGAVEGTIFAMNPDTMEVIKSKLIRPSLYNSSKWFPYRLQWGPDGMLYTTLSRSLIAIDPETLAHKVIIDDFINNMTIGIDGSIYYALGKELYRIAVPETDATLKSISINGKPIASFSPGITHYSISSSPTKNVTIEATQAGAQTEIVTLDDQTTAINVTATDGKSSLQYQIHWSEEDGKDGEDQKQKNGDLNNGKGDDNHVIGGGTDKNNGKKKPNKNKPGNKRKQHKAHPSSKGGSESNSKRSSLPNTATNYYNYIFIGLLLIGFALFLLYYNRKRKSN